MCLFETVEFRDVVRECEALYEITRIEALLHLLALMLGLRYQCYELHLLRRHREVFKV